MVNTLKIAALLTNYLYERKKLILPGIGYFSIDPSLEVPDPADKNFVQFLYNIQFVEDTSLQLDEELIDYIRQLTGKIRPLAKADFESYLSDCKLILNIGKPLYMEGIGTIQKNKRGQYSFIAGEVSTEKVESFPAEKPSERNGERKFLYNSEYTSQDNNDSTRKIVFAAAIVIGLIIIVWGGYQLYNWSVSKAAEIVIQDDKQDETQTTDSILPINKTNDTVATPATKPAVAAQPPKDTSKSIVPAGPVANYKFVLQVTRQRSIAEGNYSKIKPGRPDLQIVQKKDSSFMIFLYKSCAVADTQKIKQELNNWYWGKKEMKVFIDK
jgi:hypothetical protein